MSDPNARPLDDRQLVALEAAFHQGSTEASTALAKWIGKPSVVEIDALKQLPLVEATGILAASDEPICFCALQIEGPLHGEMILAFDDESGLDLADMLLGQPPRTSKSWGEMETSAALETTNIVCSAYLNALSRNLTRRADGASLMPTPPRFQRDFAESLMQFALMEQAAAGDHVIVALTRFEIDEVKVNWTLLFVPNAETMARMPEFLSGNTAE